MEINIDANNVILTLINPYFNPSIENKWRYLPNFG